MCAYVCFEKILILFFLFSFQTSGVFLEDSIPDDVFPIGDDVFVVPKFFRGNLEVHIRRYKKYGKKYYPTAEGVTLLPSWIEYIIGRKQLPQSSQDLAGSFFLPEDQIEITSSDFMIYTFHRHKETNEGETVTRKISLTSSQWSEMTKRYNDIASCVLDYMYGSIDFLKAYKTIEEGPISDHLPESLDVNLGIQCLQEILKDSLSDCLKEYVPMKDPSLFAEELCGNKVETFNSAAFELYSDFFSIAKSFYDRLGDHKPFLCLSKPRMYVTTNFLKNVRLQDVLREVRNVLCPTDITEYYEDVYNIE